MADKHELQFTNCLRFVTEDLTANCIAAKFLPNLLITTRKKNNLLCARISKITSTAKIPF
jgi:hypothetical protein